LILLARHFVQLRLLAPIGISLLLATPASAQERLGIVVQQVATFPSSEPTPPPTDARLGRHSRINYLGEIPDASGRKYVPDLNGKLYLLRDSVPTVYLDLASVVGTRFFSGRGLGSGFGFVAFHPEFAKNAKFYTVHTETPAGPPAVVEGVVSEWTADDPRASTFRGSHREILRLQFPAFVHGIQQISFRPGSRPRDDDYGLLYVAVGDGGQGVSSNIPQDTSVPYGKILRVDPATGARAIFALGLRDPHRFSWDETTGRMFVTNIGEHRVESVYDVRKGDNLGWSEREGDVAFDRSDPCATRAAPPDARYVGPVATYMHDAPPGFPCNVDVGHGISGGFVYRGCIPALRGKYVFADIVDGRVMYAEEREMRRGAPPAGVHELAVFDAAGRETTMPLLAQDTRVDLRFGRDADGELYLLSKANGVVWKVIGTREVTSPVFPSLRPNLVAYYDFEYVGNVEPDMGASGTTIALINGGARMRVRDHGGLAIQLGQKPGANDDWKAGVYVESGVATLARFAGARGATIMGWFRMTGPNPSPGYDAVGLAGLLHGASDGHVVRALIEEVTVNGELRLAAIGRREDGGRSQEITAPALPQNRWVFVAATFDFSTGAMVLYQDGRPVAVSPPTADSGATSPTNPRGIKIGGSFPQNTRERNPCNCRADDLMFLDRVLSPLEVGQQYRRRLLF